MSSPPTTGQPVHYRSFGTPDGEYASQCRAAIVTAPPAHHDDETQIISLAVLNPTGLFFDTAIAYASPEQGKGGTWHWPCARSPE